MIRQMVVAGQFYSRDPDELRFSLQRLLPADQEKRTALGVVVPHAGHIYSGGIAGSVFSRVQLPDTVLLMGPNHHGYGSRIALYPSGQWQTPLGQVARNERLAGLLLSHCPAVQEDAGAHQYEHSLEVVLPFLQIARPDLTIVPVSFSLCRYDECERLGIGLAAAISHYHGDVLMVVSSDMSHYETETTARYKDKLAIDRMLDLDPEGLLNVCLDEEITMCGMIPATVMLVAARKLGAVGAELLAYTTSAEVTGDTGHVVGYAGVRIS